MILRSSSCPPGAVLLVRSAQSRAASMMMPQQQVEEEQGEGLPEPPSSRPQQRSNAHWIAAAATTTGLVLLLLFLLGGPDGGDWGGGGGTGSGGRLRLFRRPLASQEATASVGPAGNNKGSSLRRPGQALGATDVLWGLAPPCLAALYHGKDDPSCGCTTAANQNNQNSSDDVPGDVSALAFEDGPPASVPQGREARATLRSTHACSDVLNAAFRSGEGDNVLGREVVVPARVWALDTGGLYELSATLPYPGTYTLKVRSQAKQGHAI